MSRSKQEVFLIDCINFDGVSPTPQTPEGQGHEFHNLNSPSLIDAICQIWLKVI